MRESSLIPTNLLNWPRVAPLLPELKLLLLALWSSPYMSCAGCGLVPLRPFASSLGLSPEATQSGLELLEKTGLIAIDGSTGEIYICDWFRFHKFQTGRGYSMLMSALDKIESAQLLTLARSHLPAAPSAQIKNVSALQARRSDDIDERTGVIVRDASDRDQLEALIQKHSDARIKSVADSVRGNGSRAFVSTILQTLKSETAQYGLSGKVAAGTQFEQEM